VWRAGVEKLREIHNKTGGRNAGFLREILRSSGPTAPLGVPLTVRLPRILMDDAKGAKSLDVVFVMDASPWFKDWKGCKDAVRATMLRLAASMRGTVRCGFVQFGGETVGDGMRVSVGLSESLGCVCDAVGELDVRRMVEHRASSRRGDLMEESFQPRRCHK